MPGRRGTRHPVGGAVGRDGRAAVETGRVAVLGEEMGHDQRGRMARRRRGVANGDGVVDGGRVEASDRLRASDERRVRRGMGACTRRRGYETEFRQGVPAPIRNLATALARGK